MISTTMHNVFTFIFMHVNKHRYVHTTLQRADRRALAFNSLTQTHRSLQQRIDHCRPETAILGQQQRLVCSWYVREEEWKREGETDGERIENSALEEMALWVCVYMWKYMYICTRVPMVLTQVLPLTTARSPQWPWVEQGVVSWIPIGCLLRHKAAVRPTFSLCRIIQSPRISHRWELWEMLA